MKYLKQLLIILAFSLAGDLLQEVIPLPIPAAIYGFVLLFGFLATGLLKETQIEDVAGFLIRILPLLFIPPAVNILSYYHMILPELAAILTMILVSTGLVFGVSGLVTDALCRKENKKDA